MLTKHKSNFAVYTQWIGRDQHTLVEECDTLREALEKALVYIHPSNNVYVVDKDGNVEWSDNPWIFVNFLQKKKNVWQLAI